MFRIIAYKYCLIFTVFAVLAGCQNVAGPVGEERLVIKTISKWKVDTLNDSKIARVVFKEFDKTGFLVLQEDFTNEGKIVTKSTYTYDSEKSLEEKSSFTETGEVKDKSKTEYVYDRNRRVIKQINYDGNGVVNDIHTFDYDSNGNLIKKTQTYSNTGNVTNVNIDYQYNQTGELVERVTKNETGNLSRDSISYQSELKKVTVFRFNSEGRLSTSTCYNYNELGSIISEMITDYFTDIRSKYIYEYTYFTIK